MSDPQDFPYATHLDLKFPALTVVDVPALVANCRDRWYNQTLCQVNGAVVRLGVMQGEYHWHKHDDDDEFFFVLEGSFLVDLEDHSRRRSRRGRATSSREGYSHRTRAPRARGDPHGGERGDHPDGRLVRTTGGAVASRSQAAMARATTDTPRRFQW